MDQTGNLSFYRVRGREGKGGRKGERKRTRWVKEGLCDNGKGTINRKGGSVRRKVLYEYYIRYRSKINYRLSNEMELLQKGHGSVTFWKL